MNVSDSQDRLDRTGVSPLAGKPPDPSMLMNIPRLVAAYYTERPDPSIREQRVSFGTSGHRGSSLDRSFNEWHVLAISAGHLRIPQAKGIDGPLFIGIDTHALSEPALRQRARGAGGQRRRRACSRRTTTTRRRRRSRTRSSTYNRGRTTRPRRRHRHHAVAQPAGRWRLQVQPAARRTGGCRHHRVRSSAGRTSCSTTACRREADARTSGRSAPRPRTGTITCTPTWTTWAASWTWTSIRGARLSKLGVDPLGGAGVHYWGAIAERYGLNLTRHRTSTSIRRSASWTWIGTAASAWIRRRPTRCSRSIGLKDRFDVAFACDTDHDRHGIVTQSVGTAARRITISPCACTICSRTGPAWTAECAVGKTVVSQQPDRSRGGEARAAARTKCRSDSSGSSTDCCAGWLGFGGEESAGASFLRRDGTVWTTDKDGIAAALLAAEMTARTGRDPGELYAGLTREFGDPVYERIDAPATREQKAALAALVGRRLHRPAGRRTHPAGADERARRRQPIGGVKVVAEHGWFAARPSGTEDLYKLYAESFTGEDHLRQIQHDAQRMVAAALARERA